ncbi:MAG: ATP-dependent helicase, partial [Fastidiosipila sp.]|nr:ATP-dependent helicase [Fastidiosipila sp.]
MVYELLSNLNDYQIQAVLDDSPACLVNAQVGSGKTTVLIAKVFYLNKVKEVSFKDMIVLTFTNKAANEIKERIKNFDESVDEKEMPYFGTFHSVALKMMRTILPVEELGYTQDFSVIDPDEEAEIAERLISTNGIRIKYESKLRRRLELAEQGKFLYANMKYEDDIQTLIKWLQEDKIQQNKMSFNDLINNAKILAKKAAYRPQWIIIDEFQDSNEMQLEFIRALAGNQTKIFTVGDPNQIIYSWRGSIQNVFSSFKNEFNANELSLPINYRSCTTILEVAKCFLVSNSDLSGLREQGSKITIRNHYNPFNEAQYLCDSIADIVSQGNQHKDIAILYRLQRQSSTLKDAFDKCGIPYEISMRKTLKDIQVLAWFISLIRFSVNNNDIESAINVITNIKYGEHFPNFEIKNEFKGGD